MQRRTPAPDTPAPEGATIIETPFQGLIRYERQMPVHQISYYLCGEIQEPQYYTELFYTLRTAAETDLIYLHINSPGGDFDTGLQIINNMLASEARVVTVVEARAYSMAAFIFLSGDQLVVHDNCQLMFHIYSGSFAGKGNEQLAEVMALGSWFEKVMTRICSPFLSATEINRILKGSDVWMDSDEIRKRLLRLIRTKEKTKKSDSKVTIASVNNGKRQSDETQK
ncbi:MAG: Clp protease ClpP [Rhodocyclaceae bacterium]|nr:MAG: Clp protease ClpP [Rhodocyclaceae bacterium]